MQAGQFDTRVTFQEATEVDAPGGGRTRTWQEVGGAGNGSRWAAIWEPRVATGVEQVSAGAEISRPQYRLIVRTDATTRQITNSHRVEIDAMAYDIRAVGRPDRRRGTIEMIIQAM